MSEHFEITAIAELHSVMERLTAERDMFHALLCVVMHMDETDRTTTVKVFRACMPSLAALFRDGDGDALYLNEAVDRALDYAAAKESK